MTRVLISTSTLPVRSGDGMPRFVLDLAQTLAGRCEVTVLAPDAPGAERREQIGGVDVRRFTYFLPRRLQSLAYGLGMRDNLRARPLSRLQVLPFLLVQALATGRMVGREKVDVVNSHWLVPQGLSTALVRGTPQRFLHVLSVHAGDVYLLARLRGGRRLARFVLDRTDHVFADGSDVGRHLEDLAGRPIRSTVQPMGVRPETFASGPGLGPDEQPFGDGFVLFVGRFVEKKGVVHLLRAWPRVLRRYPETGLVLVGHGVLETDLRREVGRLGIDRSVLFAGRRAHRDIGRYLRSSRLAVVPSIVDRHGETDGMPTVVLEAMSSGTPVVGSAVDGIPDVIRHGENGWLCRQMDPEDLAEKILAALEQPPASGLRKAIRETAERFAWPRVAERYHETFERLRAPLGEA